MKDDYPEIPEEIKELLERGEQIDEIRLDRDGNWFHNGQPFINKKIIDFFNRSISVTRDGAYCIHYDKYTYPIVVEDAPLFVTGVWHKGFGRWEKITINLTNGSSELLDIHSLYYKNNTLYCRVATYGVNIFALALVILWFRSSKEENGFSFFETFRELLSGEPSPDRKAFYSA